MAIPFQRSPLHPIFIIQGEHPDHGKFRSASALCRHIPLAVAERATGCVRLKSFLEKRFARDYRGPL
jgi:hypothetical protein